MDSDYFEMKTKNDRWWDLPGASVLKAHSFDFNDHGP